MGGSCSLTNRDTRIRVLAITIPTLTRCEYRYVEADLGAEDLIFVLAWERILKASYLLDDLTSHHHAKWHSRLVPQKKRK